jgi:FkbM family methyltransferase
MNDASAAPARLPFLARIALPYARLELPGWGRLLGAAGVYRDDRWAGAPTRAIRGKLHGYTMRLSLQSWSERQTYFLGRYFELDTQSFAIASLRPGDTFIDVGGNIGMLTLLGARLVGPSGVVHTFEPNPVESARIERTLAENEIAHVRVHRLGLGDRSEKLTLTVVTDHTGMATMAEVTGDDAKLVSATYTVDVERGDDVLPAGLPGAVTVKIDIEGFECRAVRGLTETLRRYRAAVVTEVVGQHLRRAGHSAAELYSLFADLGYRGYVLGLKRKGLRHVMTLAPVGAPDESMDANVAWILPGSVHEERLRRFITA